MRLELLCYTFKDDIEKNILNSHITINSIADTPEKLIVSWNDIQIKIEVNFVLRGFVYKPITLDLSQKTQDKFHQYVKALILSKEDLYAGKICAALDRQHPRDLFDIMLLLKENEITPETRKAFVIYLAGHSRPMHELLNPNLKNLENIFTSQFAGMTRIPVSLNQLYSVRDRLLKNIKLSLNDMEKHFLLSVKKGEPDWEILEMPHIRNFPSLQWKLINIKKMENRKRTIAIKKLEQILYT